jgi:hypothetical protein
MGESLYQRGLLLGLEPMSYQFSVEWTYDADTGPPAPFGSNCILHPTAKWNPVSFGSSVLFDCVILVLTMLKVRPQTDTRSAVVQRLYHDSLWYFGVTAAANVPVYVSFSPAIGLTMRRRSPCSL